MEHPIAWTVVFVVRKARSVAFLSSLCVLGSGPDSSVLVRNLAWKTRSTAIEWSTNPLGQPMSRRNQ